MKIAAKIIKKTVQNQHFVYTHLNINVAELTALNVVLYTAYMGSMVVHKTLSLELLKYIRLRPSCTGDSRGRDWLKNDKSFPLKTLAMYGILTVLNVS